MKPRINVYVQPEELRKVDRLAAKSGVSRSGLVELALGQYLEEGGLPGSEELILRRLDRLGRQFGRLERDLTILLETKALFIRYFLTMTPPLPVEDREAASAKGQQRFEEFVTFLGRRLAEGNGLTARVMEQLQGEETDLFSLNPGEADHAGGA
ncbi:CopG family transcriptional regulator [Emcibacter nanhaiensis]|uniref:CopG family transcriptional regulator n=1 Tax=Emcibacter nanhaiensis TaxID=1505037 RepID=A0A501PGZ7_9PROT|nr:CopG family transcriptional regulator [Emcibacter nanhaiensis]TPD59312.1 CopG family transcriptional regulator [Emcibacter nanhaiensis]